MGLLRSALDMRGDLDGGEVNVHRIRNVPGIAARHHDRDSTGSLVPIDPIQAGEVVQKFGFYPNPRPKEGEPDC